MKINTYPLNARTSELTASSEKRSCATLLAASLHYHLWSVSLEDATWSSTSVSGNEIASTTVSTSEISTRFETSATTEGSTSLSLPAGLILLDKIVE